MAIIYNNDFKKPDAEKAWEVRQEETKKFFSALRQKIEEQKLEEDLEEEEDYGSGTGFGS
jgi:hypothetical protein